MIYFVIWVLIVYKYAYTNKNINNLKKLGVKKTIIILQKKIKECSKILGTWPSLVYKWLRHCFLIYIYNL